jgi:hypothetical protein
MGEDEPNYDQYVFVLVLQVYLNGAGDVLSGLSDERQQIVEDGCQEVEFLLLGEFDKAVNDGD